MTGRNGRTGRGPAATIAAGIAVAGVVGLGLLTLQGGAGAQPALPPVSPEDLVTSVLKAQPGPFEGTVQLDNELGLPALPDLPQAANGTSTAQVWSGGEGKGRVQIPSPTGERTLVSDGTTFWAWNSDDRTVTKGTRQPDQTQTQIADPTKAATDVLAALQPTSTISVDGTDEVAGRPVYDLVLAPKPTERTLLREVRIAVDAQERMPLRLTVLAQGSTSPALQVGFTDLTFGPQDPAPVHVHAARGRDGEGRPEPRRAAATARQADGGRRRLGPRDRREGAAEQPGPGQAARRARHARPAGRGATDG